MKRKTWNGTFRAQQRGARNWLLSTAEPVRTDVYLQETAIEHQVLPGVFDRIQIDWHAGAVDILLMQGAATVALRASGAFVHEQRPTLYEALPLETFGQRSRTFWRRIFFIVKIPGGRALLNHIARRARA